MSWAPLIPIEPEAPDFHHCDQSYGTHLGTASCVVAGGRLPTGGVTVSYDIDGETPPFIIPWISDFDDCFIKLEIAGPATAITHIEITPDFIRGMAGWVIDQCVTRGGGVGGFVTGSIENLLEYLEEPSTNFDAAFPASSTFVTVTVSDTADESAPGDYNPTIPLLLSHTLELEAEGTAPGTLRQHFSAGAAQYLSASLQMMTDTDRSAAWYECTEASDDMTYECDSTLGTPALADCSQIEYSELGASSDSLNVGPGTSKILTSKTCNLAITAEIRVAITWEQIKVALGTLINVCLNSPITKAAGGSAYYGLNQIVPGVVGRRKKRDTLSGLNALPQHVKITLSTPGKANP